MSPPHRSAWRTRLLLALVATLLALGLLEVGARIAIGERFVAGAHTAAPLGLLGRFSPRYGWELRPSSRAHVVARRFGYDFEYTATINADGMRGAPHGREKRPGTLRLLVLGDSVGFGWGVEDDEAWPALVEQHSDGAFEVINASVPGWGTDQQLLWLQAEGARWQPDAVLLCFVANDLLSNGTQHIYAMNKAAFRPTEDGGLELVGSPVEAVQGPAMRGLKRALRLLARHSALARWSLLAEEPAEDGRGPVVRLLRPEEREGLDAEERDRQAKWDRIVGDLHLPRGVTFRLLGELKRTCDGLGVPLVAFGVPHHHDQYLYSADAALPPVEDPDDLRTVMSDALARAGRKHGFETFSIDGAMYRERLQGHDLDCGDGHLNARGNELVAREVLAYLRRRLGVEPPPRVESR